MNRKRSEIGNDSTHWRTASFYPRLGDLRGHTVFGTLLATPANGALLAAVRERVMLSTDELFGATVIDEVLVVPLLGDHAEAVRYCFTHDGQTRAFGSHRVSAADRADLARDKPNHFD